MTWRVEISGATAVAARLGAAAKESPAALARAGYRTLTEVITEAKQITPVDTGALRASGFVEPNTLAEAVQGSRVEFRAGFGGVAGRGNQGDTNSEDVGYALLVHEDLTKFHHVGSAKFLEIPARRALQTAEEYTKFEVATLLSQRQQFQRKGLAPLARPLAFGGA